MSVRLNLEPLKRFLSVMARDLRLGGSGPVRDAMKQWAFRYRSFVRERFDAYSKGAGNWAALSPATIKGRRRGKKGRVVRGVTLVGAAILRDKGILFAALQPTFTGKPGALQRDIPFGVRVGFGGPARYPGGQATIADIAGYHQVGGGRLPRREIIVDPPHGIMNAMAADMERAMEKIAK